MEIEPSSPSAEGNSFASHKRKTRTVQIEPWPAEYASTRVENRETLAPVSEEHDALGDLKVNVLPSCCLPVANIYSANGANGRMTSLVRTMRGRRLMVARL